MDFIAPKSDLSIAENFFHMCFGKVAQKEIVKAFQQVFKRDICYRFYVEKKTISKITRELCCSKNTVKKYIKENPEGSPLVTSLTPSAEPIAPVETKAISLRTLQVSLHCSIEAGDNNLKHLNILQMAKDQVEYLGISSPTDLLKIEIAFENYIQYRMFSQKVTFLNGQTLDSSWLKSTEKMVKVASKYADTSQKHLKMFQDTIKELEIKYNKRSPDFGRVKNYNIQNNEYNF